MTQDTIQPRLQVLITKINYVFKDITLLEKALSHCSNTALAQDSNERMEFLGDRILGMVIAEYLYHIYPNENEGYLARYLNYLVSRQSCAQVARTLEVGRALWMSYAEEDNGGREKDNILGDACEALIAAIYLDSNYETAREIILTLWKPVLEGPKEMIDPKSELQQWSLGRGLGLPVYTLMRRTGPDHAPHFVMKVAVNNKTATGEGNAKRAAEQEAARHLLAVIEGEG